MRSFIGKAINNLDITIALLGCIASIPLTAISLFIQFQPTIASIGGVCFITFAGYLIIKLKRHGSHSVPYVMSYRFYVLLTILFMSIILCCSLLFHFRPDPYIRPLSFFILLVIACAVIAIEISFLPRSKSVLYITLSKIIVVSLILQWSSLLIFPDSLIGTDPWYHERITSRIFDTGHIAGRADYYLTVAYHMLVGSMSEIAGLSYKWSAMVSVGLSHILCNILFIYLLGSFIHSQKTGLYAALLLGTAGLPVFFGIEIIPSTLGIAFIPIFVYLVFKIRRHNKKTAACLSIFLIVVMLLSHALGTVFTGIFLFFFWIGFYLYKRLGYKRPESSRVFLFLGIVLVIMSAGWWIFGSGQIKIVNRIISNDIVAEYLGSTPPDMFPSKGTTAFTETDTINKEPEIPPEVFEMMVQATNSYRNSIPLQNQVYNKLNIILFFAFSLIGSMSLLAKKSRNTHGFAFILAGLAFLAFSFITTATSRYFFVSRGVFFLQIMLSVSAGVALVWFEGLVKHPFLKATLMSGLFCIISLLTFLGPQVNSDNPVFTHGDRPHLALTQSELTAINTLPTISNSRIGADWYAHYVLYQKYSKLNTQYTTSRDISVQLFTREYAHLIDTLVIIRQEITTQPFLFFGGTYKLEYNPETILPEQGYQRIYSCNSVSAFSK